MNKYFNKEELTSFLKYLIRKNNEKQERMCQKHNVGDEVGFLTKEAVLISRYYLEMKRLGITFNDIQEK